MIFDQSRTGVPAERFDAWADAINKDREPLEEVESSIFNNKMDNLNRILL